MKNVFASLIMIFLVCNVYAQNLTAPVGIGTTTPLGELHVKSSQNTRVYSQSSASNATPGFGILELNGTEAWTWHYNISGGYTGFWRYGLGNALVISNGGNVGIGTNSPATKLDLGEIKLGDISAFPAEGSVLEAAWGNYIIGDVNTSQKLRIGVSNDLYTKAEIFLDNSNSPNGSISFKTSTGATGAVTRMHIDGNGRVGIGTTSIGSGYKLFVEEGIRTRKVKVDLVSWPDYVFHPSYSLSPLSQVEKFIKKYNHLPEVPSATEVQQNGLDLGDTQAILLKKIEELTMYVIEQQKEIEKLKATVNRKQKRNR